MPVSLRPASTFSRIDIAGNGLGFWKTMPIARRASISRFVGVVDVLAVEQHLAGELRPTAPARASG